MCGADGCVLNAVVLGKVGRGGETALSIVVVLLQLGWQWVWISAVCVYKCGSGVCTHGAMWLGLL